MDAFDKVEELLLAEGYSKEEIPTIMVSLVEQGFDPTTVFLGGIANMLNLLPKKRKPEPLPKTKVVPDLLPDKQQPKAPKPEFGANASKPTSYSKPTELRPGGRTPEPQFRTNQPVRNVNPARNNLFLQRTNLRAPSIPKPPAAVPGLFGRLKGIRGGPLTTAVNLATGAALDKYVVEPVAKSGSDALVRGVLALQGRTAQGKNRLPSIYGLAGPDVTPQQVEREKELEKLKPKDVKLPSYEEDPSRTAPVGAFTVSPVGSASRKKVETAIAKANAARQAQSQAQAQRLKVEPFKDTKVATGVKDPDTTPQPNQKIDPALVGAGSQVASRFTRRGDTKKRDDKKPKFGVPSQARGKIGRRQNPQ